MTYEEYQRIMEAAKAGTRSKETMAEALALDIPHKTEGDGQIIMQALESVREQMIDAGYEDIPVGTLKDMRITGLWVHGNGASDTPFPWRRGTSFTAHMYAAKAGMEWSEFAKRPLKTRDVQAMLGNKVSSTTVDQTVENMTAVQKVDMARALAADDIDSVSDIVHDTHKEAITKATKDKAPTSKTMKNPSKSGEMTARLLALEDVISRNVTFTGLITTRWEKEIADMGAFVKDTHKEAICNSLQAAADLYAALIEELS